MAGNKDGGKYLQGIKERDDAGRVTGTKKATFGEEERLLELLDEESGKRLMDTLTGVLNLSKLEAGEMDLGAGPVDLAEQAEKIAGELRPQTEGKGLALRVETGEGPTRAEDLFEPFRQASEGLARDYEGTGLGLAVTKEAAEQMGGRVEVETKEGKGTCVTVRLPTPSRTND